MEEMTNEELDDLEGEARIAKGIAGTFLMINPDMLLRMIAEIRELRHEVSNND